MSIFNRHSITLHDAVNQTTENYSTCLDIHHDSSRMFVELSRPEIPKAATLTNKDINFMNCLIMRSAVIPKVQLNLKTGNSALSSSFVIKSASERIASVDASATKERINEDAGINVSDILKPIKFNKEIKTGYKINGDEMMLVWGVDNTPTLKGQRYTVSITRGNTVNCNQ